jgi:ammonium transporter, Amt family
VTNGGSGYGHPMSTAGQLVAQAIGVGAAVVWSAIGTYLIVKFLEASVGARVSLEEERNGVELAALSSNGLR